MSVVNVATTTVAAGIFFRHCKNSSFSLNLMHTRYYSVSPSTWSSNANACTHIETDLNNTLIITKSCAERIIQLQKKDNDRNLKLRIAVEGGGCSGFKYLFTMDSNPPAEDDIVFEKFGTSVLVDCASFDLIKGSTIDYQKELIKSSFAIVNNPQSESACGCGSSFAVKQFAANPAID